MADYDARPSELSRAAELLRASDGPVEELQRVQDGLKTYSAQRFQALSTLAKMAADQSYTERAGDWDNALAGARKVVRDTLDQLLSGITEPSHTAWLLREKAQIDDDRFFSGLADLKLGQRRDEIAKLLKNFLDLHDTLDKKWMEASSEDRRIEDLELDAAKRMSDALRDAISQALTAHQRIAEAAGKLLDAVSQMPDALNAALVELLVAVGFDRDSANLVATCSLPGKDVFAKAKELGIPAATMAKAAPYLTPDPGMWVGDKLTTMLGPYLGALVTAISEGRKPLVMILLGTYAEARQRYLDQLPGQGAIMVALSNSRREIDAFVANNGLDAVRARVEPTCSALDSWSNGQSTPGLKTDAETFAKAVKTAFTDLQKSMETIYEDTIQSSKGRFIGPVDTQTEIDLLRPQEWAQRRDDMIGLQLDERIRVWRAQTMTIAPDMGNAFQQVQNKLLGLPLDLQTALQTKINALSSKLVSDINGETAVTGPVLDQTLLQASVASLKQDFNACREKLSGLLRGG